jgi:hypothetical protein
MGLIVFILIRITFLSRAHYGLLLSINHRSLQLINDQIHTGKIDNIATLMYIVNKQIAEIIYIRRNTYFR